MKMRLVALGLAAGLVPAVALACGTCIEDKVAATYDWDVVQQASVRRHVVVFAAVEAPADAKALASAAARVPGVDRASVRTADSPRALSFALDPKRASPKAALAAIERAPGLSGVRLTLVRVMR
jgi:hypothetical protein